jgi:hypothetical protein
VAERLMDSQEGLSCMVLNVCVMCYDETSGLRKINYRHDCDNSPALVVRCIMNSH